MSRRPSVVCCFVLLACGSSAPAAGPASELEFIERITAGAADTEELPLIVVLHGRGDRPERFAETFNDFARPSRLVLLRAPIDEGDGLAWFTFRFGFDRALEDANALLPRIEASIRAARARHARAGPPVLMGFSQGAMLVYAYVLKHPAHVRAAIPVSAVVPEAFVSNRARGEIFPPIRAFHGGRDEVIRPSHHREGFARLEALELDATFTEVESAPHWMTEPLRREVFRAIAEQLPR